jgi:hypothetical protein
MKNIFRLDADKSGSVSFRELVNFTIISGQLPVPKTLCRDESSSYAQSRKNVKGL